MSLSKNSILPIEKSSIPIKLKYPATYTSSWEGYDSGYTFVSSSITANFAVNTDPLAKNVSGSWARLYRLIKQLYYQNYLTGSLLNSASYFDSNIQSTACSSSTEYEYRYIPTGSSDKVAVIYIPSSFSGEQISKLTFNLKPIIGTEYDIWDDGNGNLIDKQNSNLHVGNIIYSHGMIIITHPDYAPAFVVPSSPPPPYYQPTSSAAFPLAGYVEATAISQYVQFTDNVW